MDRSGRLLRQDTTMPSEWELLLRLGCAVAAGAVLGFERDVSQRPAGLRTHALVAVGAAAFAMAGAYGFTDFASADRDPARIAAQVVSGLGFIGAGAIIRNGAEVSGLTTAATVWAAGALGLLFAAGEYVMGAGALAAIVLVLVALRPLRQVSGKVGRQAVELVFQYEVGFGTLAPVLTAVKDAGVDVVGVSVDDVRSHAGDGSGRDGSGRDGTVLRRLTIDGLVDKSATEELAPVMADLKRRPEMSRIDLSTS